MKSTKIIFVTYLQKLLLWLVIVFDNVGFKRVFSFLLHSNSAGDMLYAFGSVEWYNKLTKNIAE